MAHLHRMVSPGVARQQGRNDSSCPNGIADWVESSFKGRRENNPAIFNRRAKFISSRLDEAGNGRAARPQHARSSTACVRLMVWEGTH
jgi:hypothetical protein